MTSVRELGAAWRLYLAVLLLVLISQLIGIQQLDVGVGIILFLPLLYAFVLGLAFNPVIVGKLQPFLSKREVKVASPMIVIAIMPFIAKFGTTIGPDIDQILAAGPALLLQEIGNLGTIVLAFPVAVLLLKLGRESIGATFSVAREPSLAIVSEKYGMKSPEGTGVLAVYVVGTLFGSILYSLMGAFVASTEIFDIRALAMACGVGSGSMMAACAGSLAAAQPAMESTIMAFAGSSNLLTYATGMYASIFVAIPLVEWMYRKMGPVAATGAPAGSSPEKTKKADDAAQEAGSDD